MSSTRHEVVIAGAGLAGASLALVLARAGMQVAVVDVRPLQTGIGDFDGRASAVAYAAFRIWRSLGLGELLERDAQRIDAILVADGPGPGAAAARHAPAVLRFLGEDGADLRQPGEPLGWMVENRRLRAALAEALTKAGIAVYTPSSVQSLAADSRDAQVTLADGRVLTTPLLVGAEGRASPVRQGAGIKTWGWDYPQGGVVATVALERPHANTAYQYFLPGGPLAILPLTEDRASLVWSEKSGPARALVAASPEAFEAHLHRRFGEFLGRPRLVGARDLFPLSLQGAKALTAPRVALVGDAAHAIHPIAGQGLNLGLKDVAALAEVVIDARRLGEDWGSELVLDRYARWRRFDAAALAAATDLFNRLFSNDDPILKAVRGLGLSVVERLGPVPKRLFAQEAGAALGDLPRLLRGEAL